LTNIVSFALIRLYNTKNFYLNKEGVNPMNKKKITPNPKQPVDRVTTGKMPNLLAELEEASLSVTGTLPAGICIGGMLFSCSYDGDDE
jgi:bacteriocin leader peptide (microcyclamide/patellamide family)